jgi:hypothetical protein
VVTKVVEKHVVFRVKEVHVGKVEECTGKVGCGMMSPKTGMANQNQGQVRGEGSWIGQWVV